MPRHVFRRPWDIRRRRFVPGSARHDALVFVRRRLAAQRRVRRGWIRRNRILVGGARHEALTFKPVLRRVVAYRRANPPRYRRLRRLFPQAGAAVSAAPFTRRALRQRTALRAPQRRVHRAVPQGFAAPVAPGQSMVFVRMLRAVARMRQAARRRLFWRVQPEITVPAAPVEILGSNKGRVFSPGLVRGRISKGGA